MTETKKPRTLKRPLRTIREMSPDDPLFSRGWFVGGFHGGPRPGAKPAPSSAKTSDEPRHEEHADEE